MSRFIDLNGFQKPNLASLAERYVLELNLPSQVANYVTTLMGVLPPSFDPVYGIHVYPRYEVRVMAYIIYVLKLLFGLDDVKERVISQSAIEINKQLSKIAEDHPQPMTPLFVYTDWMEFVELRKVLVAHYNESFARRFRVPTRDERQVDDILKKEHTQREQEYNYNEMLMTPAMQRMRENVSLIFETFLKQKFGESNSNPTDPPKDNIEFQPTLTPAHSYFKRILLRAEQAQPDEMSIHIPDSMKEDHTERQLAPFKNKTSQLSEFLDKNGYKLRVEEVASQEDYQNVGMFQTLFRPKIRQKEFRANCAIKTQTWIDQVRQREKRPDFIFRQPVTLFGKQYQNKINVRNNRRQALEIANPFWKLRNTPNYMLKLNDDEVALSSIASIQAFDENNMEPLRVPLEMPRRMMKTFSTGALELKEEPTQSQESKVFPKEELLLKISNFDCWLLHGYIKNLRDIDKQELRALFPCSFRWLLDTCAHTIGVEWNILYEQLLVVEVMFHHGIEDWSNHSDHLRLKYNMINKDLNTLTKVFRDLW